MSLPIVYALMCQNNLYEVKQALDIVEPYVDNTVVVDGGSQDGSIFYLRNRDFVNLYIHPWEDNFSKQRNNYLKHAAELVNSDIFACLVSDPDEHFDIKTVQNLPYIVDSMLKGGFNLTSFRCMSQTLKGDTVVWENLDAYWKGLLFVYDKKTPPKYINNPHETLVLSGGHKIMQTEYLYYHKKQENIIWQKGARNMYIGGGGPNLGAKNKIWVELKNIVREVYGKDLSWHQFEEKLLKGGIDDRIKDWMVAYIHEDGWDGASEVRELGKLYFRVYHMEEEPESLVGVHIK